jgi:predicted Rossmann-fold nucleotide-binding protein
VGRSFWTPFVNWLNDYILKTNKISAEDLNLFQLVDSPEEAYDLVLKFNHKGRKIFATF